MSSKTRARSLYLCQECGQESPRWQGRCPACGAWNSLSEFTPAPAAPLPSRPAAPARELEGIAEDEQPRLSTGLGELDRVLGGGLVPGSLVLLGGDPGIGKSTLVLQAALAVARSGRSVLYVSGEESPAQVKLRARRLALPGRGLFLLSETDLTAALREAERLDPGLLIVDSIQTVYSQSAPQAPGSVAQLRQCTLELMQWAKPRGVPVVLIGHVTKEGEIAGPRLLEHLVDVVLYLEGERFSSYRLLRGVKNRFGSVAEVGVFEMTGRGLTEVPNPSELFLAERGEGSVGSLVAPIMEGSRCLLVEVQALTSPSFAPAPRRTANGVDFNRLVLVSAVLTRRLGLHLGNQDIVVSVVGGLRVQEPAADLAVALAIVSSLRDRPLPADLVALGEVGLSGELRSVGHLERRLAEAARLGFRRCLLPRSALRRQPARAGLELLPAASLREAVRLAFARADGHGGPPPP
jgi:DNA repair protein RadA/Sms